MQFGNITADPHLLQYRSVITPERGWGVNDGTVIKRFIYKPSHHGKT
jgi:hypothetical protein